MTDDPYASSTPGATMPPPDATTVTPDVPARPYSLPADFPVAPTADVPTQTPDAPAQTPDAPVQPTDAPPRREIPPEVAAVIATGDSPDSKVVSLDVPIEVDDVGDGKKAEIIGDVNRLKDLISQQGDNPYGMKGDCGLVSCRNIFEQFGMQATEQSVIAYAVAHGLCDTGKPGDPPEQLGGSSPIGQARILSDNGVPSHVWADRSADDLAGFVQAGRGVIIGVNAGELWHDPDYVEDGQANHAITVIGVVRDPSTQALEGFIVNDSGDAKTKVVSVDDMNKCFVQKGGVCVATDNPAPHAR